MDSLVNYGALPQSYEDPAHKDALTGLLGDGDPLDVCDISATPRATGAVYQVKVLGALAMIDGGETDGKLLAVRTDDPLAALVDDVGAPGLPAQVQKAMDDIRHWFRVYKVPEGKGENDIAFGGKWLDLDTALRVVASGEEQWEALRKGPAREGVWAGSAGARGEGLKAHQVAPSACLRGVAAGTGA